jgi:hypothetical protein
MFNRSGKFSSTFTKVYTPSITSPTTNQITASRTPTITASAFSKYGNITHLSSDWQVSDSSDFNTIRWSSTNDTTNKVSITASDLAGGDRYVRVRYKASNGVYSDWSDAILFTSPWASGSNTTLTSSTNMDVNATTTITFQPGTYRVSLWGGGGGGASKVTTGGGAGCVVKTVLYTTATAVTFTIGTGGGGATGSADNGTNVAGAGGSPGGGAGANGGGGSWNGAGGGGYSNAVSITAAGGGGGAGDVGGSGTAGGSSTGAGGTGGNGSGSAGSGGGGGGGARNNPNQSSGTGGEGGSNSGTYSTSYAGSGTTPGNPYYSSTYGRTFGQGGSAATSGQNGGARIEKIPAQNTPVVSFTSNLSTTNTSTAGDSTNFSISATDTANNDSTITYQWYLSTNGGSTYSTISGATSSTLTRYNPFYYSDNSHKIYCRATVTNTAGTSYTDSNICTLTVNRNYNDSSGPLVSVSNQLFIGSAGARPNDAVSSPGSDTLWGSWTFPYSDISYVDANTATFSAGSRCGLGCVNVQTGQNYGYDLSFELRLVRSTNSTKAHWGNASGGNGGCGRNTNYQINANGGGWTPESDGTPILQLWLLDSGTSCRTISGEPFPESDNIYINYSYRRRQYFYETRP